jgi:hypothetical protein
MAGYLEGEIPIIVRGDGCTSKTRTGKRYLDALAGLFSDQHGLLLQRGGRNGSSSTSPDRCDPGRVLEEAWQELVRRSAALAKA